MHRRSVLAAASALLAGCSGSNDGDGSTTTRSTPTTDVATTEPNTIATTTEQSHDPVSFEPTSMTIDEVQDRLAERDCAELADLPTVCPGDDARLDVSVLPTVGDLSSDAVELTVENRADEPFQWNAYDWVLRKWDGYRWRRIAPLAIPAPLHGLPTGESHTYRIVADESYPIDERRAYVTEQDIEIAGLGPGVYGFSTDGYFESSPDDEFAAAAVFGFAGEGPPIIPMHGANWVERDGSELVVRATQPERKPGELVVSLVGGDPDALLLAEHVQQLRPLLNTLPYLAIGGVETVRYTGNADNVDVLDTYLSAVTPDGTSRYGFRELGFEVSGTE